VGPGVEAFLPVSAHTPGFAAEKALLNSDDRGNGGGPECRDSTALLTRLQIPS
jgi:hypothetical protein